MLPARGSRGPRLRICSISTSWNTVGDGEFFCPACGGDRNYRRRIGRRRLTLFGVPLLPRGLAGPVVECAACHGHFGTDALDHPTTARFSGMLRDAVHTVALAVLAAGGVSSPTVLRTAVSTVRAAGYEECTAESLIALIEALAADTGRFLTDGEGPCGAALAIELHEALEPLSPHLAPAGRESILFQGARIALADGAYSQAERDVLTTVGNALQLCADDTTRLMEAARTPF
ncbi:TerB family tellurite resistance protein [Streptomyces sp. SP18CS02]|uniref:TerB family tellurite resistance protein n=1 Tax=Streptomyces sp. SP18CS02 TaxID=3002531 RepID=UPI002E793166|nr:TerB family tellurite resistance protein [Streptomyces sp. SP18CS02]MEE1753413.1 TerB family tellurite resistance protein [Streptomyces sp. SP18CS02]